MELFRVDTQIFSGDCCGAEYVHDPATRDRPWLLENPGVRLTFLKEFDEEIGFKNLTLETKKGHLYFQFRMEHDTSSNGKRYPDDIIRSYYDINLRWIHVRGNGEFINNGIWHAYSYDKLDHLKTGEIVIYTVEWPIYNGASQNTIDLYTKNLDKLKEKEGFKCLYVSDPFYNWIHSERNYPSLRLVVLEKL